MLKKSNQKGFTIIEVLIVLAIAAVILLIIFLAIPALQRNSRNTQRKADAATYVAAINEWQNNNGGVNPTSADLTTANTGVNAGAKLKFYAVPTTVTSGATAQSAYTDTETLKVVSGAKCGASGATVPAARGVALQYAVETGGGNSPQCLEG